MISPQELDRLHTFGQREPDTSMSEPGSTSHGDLANRAIKRWLKETRRKLPADPSYLALGVGQAYPEVAFAKHLRIPPEKVTMVDRYFPDYTLNRLATEFNGVELVESGIFAYLTDPPKKDFSVVSAFGIEYVFLRKEAPETFVTAMKNVVAKDGIVFINFYCGKNVDSLWRRSGFEVVMPHEDSHSQVMYVKRD